MYDFHISEVLLPSSTPFRQLKWSNIGPEDGQGESTRRTSTVAGYPMMETISSCNLASVDTECINYQEKRAKGRRSECGSAFHFFSDLVKEVGLKNAPTMAVSECSEEKERYILCFMSLCPEPKGTTLKESRMQSRTLESLP